MQAFYSSCVHVFMSRLGFRRTSQTDVIIPGLKMTGLITGTLHDMSRLCTSCLKLDNLKPPCDPAQDNLVRTMDGLPASAQRQFVVGFSGAS